MVEFSMESVCTKITEVNLSAFVYRLFQEDFSSPIGTKYIGNNDYSGNNNNCINSND